MDGLQGKAARIRLLDARDGSWGFIMADHFVFTDAEAVSFPPPIDAAAPEAPALAPTDVIPGMTVPAGTKVTIFAEFDTHKLTSPSSLDIDEQGKVLVTEVHRLQEGILDNRRHRYWILEDNAATTVDDRRAMLKRWEHKVSKDYMTRKSDLVRLLADTDGDGVADKTTVYSDGYNDLVDGTASGIFAFEGSLERCNLLFDFTLQRSVDLVAVLFELLFGCVDKAVGLVASFGTFAALLVLFGKLLSVLNHLVDIAIGQTA